MVQLDPDTSSTKYYHRKYHISTITTQLAGPLEQNSYGLPINWKFYDSASSAKTATYSNHEAYFRRH